MDLDPLDAASIPPDAKYVASGRARLYYSVAGDAWHGIAPADRVWFSSEQAARDAGYEPSVVVPEGLDEFEIVEELGRGGAAVVYRARDRVLAREVAIKVIRASHHDDEETLGRSAREARTLARLQHPGIVSVYGVKTLPAGGLALIMEYVPGRTLRDLIGAEGPLSVERAESILRDVGEALAAAHRSGVVHRDVKPGNIFLHAATGHALLADFGIALSLDDTAKITRGGAVLGTPAYMSPEQIDGQDVDGRSDLYSLGLVGWEMLTGRPPWEGESLYGVIYKQKRELLPPLRRLRPDVPVRVRMAIEGALAKNPDARWSGVEEFLSQLSGEVRGPWWVRRSFEWPRTRRDVVGLATLRAGARAGTTQDEPTVRLERAGSEALEGQATLPSTGVSRWRPGLASAAAALLLLGAAGITAARGLRPDPEPAGRHAPPVAVVPPPDEGPRPRSAPTTTPATSTAPAPVAPDTVEPGAEPSRPVDDPRPAPAVATDGGGGPTPAPSPPPAPEEPSLPIDRARSLIAAGGMHTCAIDTRGTLSCWGGNDRGQLGIGGGTRQSLPVRVDVGGPARSVTAGGFHNCALDRQGVAHCWGDNRDGQLGGGTRGVGTGPVRVAGRSFHSLALGIAHTCGIAQDGRGYCWGSNVHGQLGDGGSATRANPARIRTSDPFVTLAAGWNHTCALTARGRALCWGENAHGQLGNGGRSDQPVPAAVLGDFSFQAISAGSAHTCGLAADGEVLCWGQNTDGRLGDGTTTDRSAPTRVQAPQRFTQITAGGRHTCGLTGDGRAFCWGQNNYGQLGDGGTSPRSTPARVETELRFVAIRSSGSHTCGVGADGSTHCWGYNIEGQLGDGTLVHRLIPQRVGSLSARSD